MKRSTLSTREYDKPTAGSPLAVEFNYEHRVPLQPNQSDWKVLYRAAILETNKSKIPQRVSDAEKAALARGREIFYSNCDVEEKEALEDALYALRAFKTAWQHTDAA